MSCEQIEAHATQSKEFAGASAAGTSSGASSAPGSPSVGPLQFPPLPPRNPFDLILMVCRLISVRNVRRFQDISMPIMDVRLPLNSALHV